MTELVPTVSEWCGEPRFECPVEGCAFDSLSEPNVVSHIATAHPPPAAKPYDEPAPVELVEVTPQTLRVERKPRPKKAKGVPPTHEVSEPESPVTDVEVPAEPEGEPTDG